MTSLVQEYGYYSKGESFSIGDPDEVWIMDLIGKGPGRKGAVWVARRVPDGYISGHANAARIRQFPLNDKKNTPLRPGRDRLRARDVAGTTGTTRTSTSPPSTTPTPSAPAAPARPGSGACSSVPLPAKTMAEDWILGTPGAEPVPLWIKPARKLSVARCHGLHARPTTKTRPWT